jgi:hypothetical protein
LLGVSVVLVALIAAVLFFAIALLRNLYRLSDMAIAGVEGARDGLAYLQGFFTLTSGL